MKWIAALFPSKEKPVPSSSTKICCKESIVIVYFIRSLTAYKGWFFFLVIISALGGLLELVFPLGVRDLLEEGVFLQSWPFSKDWLSCPCGRGGLSLFPPWFLLWGKAQRPCGK